MVSNARELLPDPDTPLTTVSLPWGISQEMFFKLWVRAPRITIASFAEVNENTPEGPSRRTRPLSPRSRIHISWRCRAHPVGEWLNEIRPTPHCPLQEG